MRIEESDDFRKKLAAVIPEAVRLLQFLRFGVQFRLERGYEHHLLTETDGLLITEPGFVNVPSCLIWFRVDRSTHGDVVITLYDVATPPPLEEQEDDS